MTHLVTSLLSWHKPPGMLLDAGDLCPNHVSVLDEAVLQNAADSFGLQEVELADSISNGSGYHQPLLQQRESAGLSQLVGAEKGANAGWLHFKAVGKVPDGGEQVTGQVAVDAKAGARGDGDITGEKIHVGGRVSLTLCSALNLRILASRAKAVDYISLKRGPKRRD